MSAKCCSCLQGVVNCYNAFENIRKKVAEFRADYSDLKANSRRLSRIKNVVQKKVSMGTANQLEEDWLQTAVTLDNDLVEFLGEVDQVLENNGDCLWWYVIGCRNLGNRTSQRQKRLNDRLMVPCARENENSISTIDEAQTEPVIRLLGGQHTVFVANRNSDEFWTQFHKENVQVIGIHGMIGIGKTTFLKKINDQFSDDHRGYDMVIYVDQSSNSKVDEEIQRIQDDIAKRLGQTLPKGPEIRRKNLRGILSRMNVLLLLDNLLDGVTLLSLGIPILEPALAPPAPAKGPLALPVANPTTAPDNQPKLCKVVLTAREKLTGRNIGATVHEIELDLLDEEDARKLFKFKVWQHHPYSLTIRKQQCTDESGKTKSVEDMADEIADICGGLPLALDNIGEHLQRKSRPEEWKTELERLGEPERAPANEAEGKVYARLKEAYNCLKDSHSEDDASEKKCFLYCSLFPNGHAIEESELQRHWMVEELLGKVRRKKTLHDYFNRAVSILEKLKRAHLLRSSSDQQSSVKMHSQFHCMARWVAEREFGEKIFGQSDGKLDELSTMLEEHQNEVKRIFLMKCGGNLNKIDCPNLSTLVIRRSVMERIESDVFDSIQGSLKVLDLATCTLPGFELNNVKMSSLQYLNLSHTNITCFPFDLEELSKLKILDLSFTEELIVTLLKTLSALADLRYLNFYYCGTCGSSQQSQGASTLRLLEDVEKLNHLGVLAVTISGNRAFQKLENFSKLNLTHSMVIINCDGVELNLQFIATAKKLGVLHVIRCSAASLSLPQHAITAGKCFESLCNVEISHCWNLMDLTWLKYAPALQSLKIANCPKLTQVINPPAGTQADQLPFDKLKNLELSDLPELCSIFCQDLPFSSLESIIVRNSGKLKTIPIADNKDRRMSPVIDCQKRWWERIEDDARKSRLRPVFR